MTVPAVVSGATSPIASAFVPEQLQAGHLAVITWSTDRAPSVETRTVNQREAVTSADVVVTTLPGTRTIFYNAPFYDPRVLAVDAQNKETVTIAELNATSDIGRLYDIWLRTRDEWVEKKLKQAGLLVDPGSKVIQ